MGWQSEWSAGGDRRICLVAELYGRFRKKNIPTGYDDFDKIISLTHIIDLSAGNVYIHPTVL